MVFQLVKKHKWFNCSDAAVKQVTVAVIAATTVFAASGWQFNQTTAMQAAGAGIVALVNHKAVLTSSVEATSNTCSTG